MWFCAIVIAFFSSLFWGCLGFLYLMVAVSIRIRYMTNLSRGLIFGVAFFEIDFMEYLLVILVKVCCDDLVI